MQIQLAFSYCNICIVTSEGIISVSVSIIIIIIIIILISIILIKMFFVKINSNNYCLVISGLVILSI